MNRITSFLAGVVVGATGIFGMLKYHVVRAEDGMHLVPKMSSHLGEIYVDIREFDLSDWNEHRALAVAIVRADKADLLNRSASDNLRHSIDRVLDGLGG